MVVGVGRVLVVGRGGGFGGVLGVGCGSGVSVVGCGSGLVGVVGVLGVRCGDECWWGLVGWVWGWVLMGFRWSGVVVGVGGVSVVGCGGGCWWGLGGRVWWWVLVGSLWSGVVVGVGGVSVVECGGGGFVCGCGAGDYNFKIMKHKSHVMRGLCYTDSMIAW